MRAIRAVAALVVLAAIICLPPWALLRFLGNPWPTEGVDLAAPLTDDAVLGLLAVLVWVLWLQLVVCIVVEAMALLTDDRVQLTVPLVFPVQRHLARQLITAVALAATSTSLAASLPATAHALAPSTEVGRAASASDGEQGPRLPVAWPGAATHHPGDRAMATGSRATSGSKGSEIHAAAAPAARGKPSQASVAVPSRAPQLDTPRLAGEGDRRATVAVMRLDSLWSIAERVLGDGERWPEIAALNEGRLMVDGTRFTAVDHIRPGWQLHLPEPHGVQDADPLHHDRTVIVGPGDTLSQIALDELGDATAYPAIYDASRNLLQSDGQRLSDPDVIDVGWTLAIPRATPSQHTTSPHDAGTPGDTGKPGDLDEGPREEPPQTHHADETRPHEVPPPSNHHVPGEPPGTVAAPPTSQDFEPHGAPGGAPSEASSQLSSPFQNASPSQRPSPPQPAPSAAARSQGIDQSPAQGEASSTAITALRALLASAICLAGGALALLIAARRRQHRHRRVGRALPSTPEELADVERAVVELGDHARTEVEFLDRALRDLAATCRDQGVALPRLSAVVSTRDSLRIRFDHPPKLDPPRGWSGDPDAVAWEVPRSVELSTHAVEQPAPYPALVSVGLDEDGATWLVDLERLRLCAVQGSHAQMSAHMRFIIAELAINAWSAGVEVLLMDADALVPVALNPLRLRTVSLEDALARTRAVLRETDEVAENLGADVLARRRDGILLDATYPVIVALGSEPTPDLDHVVQGRGHSRVVLFHPMDPESDGSPSDQSPFITFDADGSAYVAEWDVRLRPFLLTPDEAGVITGLLASSRDMQDAPMPVTHPGTGHLQHYARADGSLREEFTALRTGAGDPSSQLPQADEVYLSAAATTPKDLAAAAPAIAETARSELAGLDPSLDQDVADWFDPDCPRPKVHVLGPVEVTAPAGGDPTAIDNLAGTVSFITYLACQDRGVTAERVAAAFGWKTTRTVQNRATNARYLLGTRSDGSDWLPDAGTSEAARRGGAPTYELIRSAGGVLNSADLFFRLRSRAQRRGDHCEEDLLTALALVTGTPFESATEYRFKWLFQPGEHRLDQILIGAIEDVAHILATRALAAGRPDMARTASRAALKANPNGDIAWLDKAAAEELTGDREAATRLVREHVLDASDEDISLRSETIIRRRRWDEAG